MTDNKTPKIEFAPGAFDNFEGSQEELDQMIADIQKMFEGKTMEEIQFMSRPMTDEDFDELPDDVKEQLIRSFEEDMDAEAKRKLQ